MPALVETMAYRIQGGKPWHEFGEGVANNLSIDEFAAKAGLIYTIEEVPIYARIGQQATNDKNQTYRAVKVADGYKLIWSPEYDTIFQVASNRYHPVQPKEVAQFFKEFCDRGELELETAGVLKEGAINWALAKTTHSFTLPGEDVNHTYVMIATSHDGSLRTIVLPTSVRVVCWNTLMLAIQSANKMFKLKHSAKFTAAKKEEAKKTVGLIVDSGKKFAEAAHQLAATRMDADTKDLLVYRLTQSDLFNKIVEESNNKLSASAIQKVNDGSLLAAIVEEHSIIDRLRNESEHNRVGKAILSAITYGIGQDTDSATNTLWGFVNGVTYYTDHEAGKNQDARLTSAWFGNRASLKENALELALEVANVN